MQDTPARAEIGCVFLEFFGFKDDLPNEGSECGHVAVNEPNIPQISTIRRSRTVIESVPWFVANGALVTEIWPFQVLEGWGVQKPSLLNFTRGFLVVYTLGLGLLMVCILGSMVCTLQECNHAQTMCKPEFMTYMAIHAPRGGYTMTCPACMEQAKSDSTT